MQNNFYFLVSFLLVLTGCGGGSNSSPLDFSKTEAAFDLREYLLPTTELTSYFTEETYINSDGVEIFSDVPNYTASTAYAYEIDDNIYYLYEDGTLADTITLQEDRMTLSYDIITYDIVRYADIGDTINYVSLNETVNGINFIGSQNCQLENHYDSLIIDDVTYYDVIEATCQGSVKADQIIDGARFYFLATMSSIDFEAKGIGTIKTISTECTNASYKNNYENSCEKTVSVLNSVVY